MNRRSFLRLGMPSSVARTVTAGKNAGIQKYPLDIEDISIGDVKFKLVGVSHTGEFAREWNDFYDNLVQESVAVVTEANVNLCKSCMIGDTQFSDAIHDLSRKHGKAVFYTDARNENVIWLSMMPGSVGIALAAYNVHSSAKNRKISRRNVLLYGMGLLMIYFGFSPYSSPFSNVPEEFQYNAVVDYDNVKIAEGLHKVPGMLDEKEKSSGEYVMVTYGAAHIEGIKRYTTDDNFRKYKLSLYKPTYEILGNKAVTKSKFFNGKWNEVARVQK